MRTLIKLKFTLLILLVIPTEGRLQQLASYNMYNLYQPIINPAAMGSYDRITTAGVFNTQMLGFDGAPMNFLVDATIPIGKTNAVIGGQIMHDRIGARNTTKISTSFAYRVPINLRNYLSFGITASVQLMNANFQDLVMENPNDPLLANQSYQIWSPDFRLGAYYFRDNFYAGFSVDNLFTASIDQPNARINPDEIHFNLQAGYNFRLTPLFNLQPSVLWRQVSGSSTQFDVNLQLKYRDSFGVGISYRTLNTLVLQSNIKIAKRFTIGYSFNFGMGSMNGTQFTGHEIFLMFQVPKAKRKIAIETPHY